MKTNLLMIATIIVSSTVLLACAMMVPGKVIYSEGLTDKIESKDLNIKTVILLNADGMPLFYNIQGASLQKCKLPKPHEQPMEMSKMQSDQRQKPVPKANPDPDDIPVCSGLTEGSAVTSIRSISILRTNSRICWILGPDASGTFFQYCP